MVRTFAVLALFLSFAAQAATHPTFVLVHGALFTSAGWMKAQSRLQNDGYNVVTVDVPGRAGDGLAPQQINIQVAAKKICKVAELQDGPVILVGHSQGGAVITQATEFCASQIKALIYVTAVAPKSGETAFDMLNPQVDVNFMKCATPDPAKGLFVLNPNGPLQSSFFQDIHPADAPAALASMVSEPMGVGTTKLSFDEARRNQIPKHYIETLKDQVLSPGTQKRIQARFHWDSIRSMQTGHSPFLTHPAPFVKILEAIEATL